MNKQELLTAIAEKGLLTKAEANSAIEALTETIAEELQKKAQLVGFGALRHENEKKEK